jgi:hypothetical protein
MHDTIESVLEYLDAVFGPADEGNYAYAGSYGEPGYSNAIAPERLVVLADYWCRCDPGNLHDYASHHPKTFEALEDSGVQFEWYDEWLIDHNSDKAYRTQPDSYSWQPSWVDGDGELVTIDDDIDVWIDYALNDKNRAILSSAYSGQDIEKAGFTKFNDHSYESGWHEGQTDTPEKAVERLYAEKENVEFVFGFDENSQFYVRFSLYYREADED